ncbi:DUF3320 domain-containing protein [Pseudonocardia hierapolitana]|uniref:DUF3320 domain-containing protein n=1 Tax=Pseudonocardia hierapolitana TaxID=1128676 RepID=UPI001BAE72B0|nr:DUF3320 domain-containing protein [Pseudonocardia hierapolitana]
MISRLAIDHVVRDVPQARLQLEVADASGLIGVAQEILVDLEAGRPTVLTDVTLRLDPAAMLRVEEQRPAVIRARLETDGQVLAEQVVRTRVLAAHQWLAAPPTLALEMLAAHVMPNHPAVTALMNDVAQRLQMTTGSPSLEGYQSGAERVDQIVAAVYEVMRARGIRYAEPPASWADTGQKVRTPGEVLDGQVGTCLDTVVVMAAALEQAGVRPLLWLVDGHAFLGYWREASSLGTVAEFDTAGVVNRIDLGQIGLVETTLLTERQGPVPFDDAQRAPYVAHLTGDLAKVIGVVDVHQARVDRVVPLPAHTRGADGQVLVTVYTPATAQPAGYVAPAASDRSPTGRTTQEPQRVTTWKNALLDLSLRNRLINFTERSALSLVVPKERLGQVEDLLNAGTVLTLRPSDEVAAVERERGIRHGRDLPQAQLVDLLEGKRTLHADVTDAAYATRMRGIAYKARTVVEETGANNLYLALGSLVWELDGRTLRSPLILLPVVLKAAGRGGPYRLGVDEAGTSTPNYCLIEKLRQVHGLQIPGLAEPPEDGAGIDLDAAFESIRRTIAARGLRFRVEPTADVAILQFAKFRLWKDLDENWASFAQNPLVEHLIHSPAEAFADPVPEPEMGKLDELDEQCPVPADASQLRAIAEATAGRTFVLEGPPGTGKSQTITNLLTHAVAQGKWVLFVAEKRAALDVVQKRLDAVGMGPLSLDLHDKGSKPAAVREQIKRALEHVAEADPQDHTIKTEELRSARRSLTRYVHNLHHPNAAGLSLYAARTAELAIGDDVLPMPIPESLLTGGDPESVARLRQLFSTLPDRTDAARPRPEHPWAFIDSAAGIDVEAVLHAARRFDMALHRLPGVLAPALDAVRTPADLDVLAELMDADIPLPVLHESRSARWDGAVRAIVAEVAEFASTPHPGLDVVTPDVLGLPITEIDADARTAAASRYFGRKKRLIAVRDQLASVVRPEAKVVKPKRLPELTGHLVDLDNAVQELVRKVEKIPGLLLPPGWTPFTHEGRGVLAARIDRVRRAGQMVDPGNPDPYRARFAPALQAVLSRGMQADPGPLREAGAAAHHLLQVCAVTPDAVVEWAGPLGLLVRWQQTAAERLLADPRLGSLRRWLDLLHHLEPLRAARFDEARAGILAGTINPDDATRSFELGLARTSLRERLRDTGLESFDVTGHERSIARFVTASQAVRGHLTGVVPQQVLAARGFNPQAAGGQVGQLQRQLSVRRGGMKVRELMSRFGDVITRALPCVLVSPDSLARFFPAAAGLFDIVVFDEASQVRVADAIGAMGRARSVVVVGDSKQMPPTSFAESSFPADDLDIDGSDDAPVEDEESILTECVQARVGRHRLSWHYRSRDESLIAFSNHHYYDGGLSSFPAPTAAGTGVSLVRVDGHFHRSGPRKTLRTNSVEAEAVVAEIRRRFDASPDRPPSLGVVTFNQQQRAYIEGLLRDADDQRLIDALEDPDGLFVKNLENVQGDERDLILFSTAFSVNDKGVLPLNFGPLNRAGGERRLNVAVTRARRQVIVFSSFDPGQLRTEETSSVGLKHLRTYLEMAAKGPEVLPRDTSSRIRRDRHREDIAARLRERGLTVRTNVGLSDFVIDLVLGEPDEPRVAVLLDGPAWASRLTARDRDALPHEVLVDVLGWPAVERVWLPTWLADPDAVVARLATVAAQAERRAPVDSGPPARVEAAPPGPRHAAKDGPTPQPERQAAPVFAAAAPARPDLIWPTDAEMFVPWTPRPLGTRDVLDALPSRTAAGAVAAALDEVVAAEGPIHLDRLARLVANGFGLSRVAGPRKEKILRHLPRGLRRDAFEPVVWPATRIPEEWTGYRRSPEGLGRPLEEIPLREIVNAMAGVARAAAGAERGDLHREVLAVFGWKRRTAGVTERLDLALDLGVRAGRLRFDGEIVVSASDQ